MSVTFGYLHGQLFFLYLSQSIIDFFLLFFLLLILFNQNFSYYFFYTKFYSYYKKTNKINQIFKGNYNYDYFLKIEKLKNIKNSI